MAPRIRVSAFAAFFALSACQTEAPPEPTPPTSASDAAAAAATITADDLRSRIGVLAADSMRGRNTPSPELDQAALWIASEFERLGLEPGAGGDFIQRYAIRTVMVDAAGSSAALGDASLEFGVDVMPSGQPVEREYAGPLTVLSGSGPVAEVPADAVRGRHVLVTGRPETEVRGGINAMLQEAGALAVWRVDTRDDQAWQAMAGRALGPRTVRVTGDEPGLAAVSVRQASLGRALDAAGLDAAALLESAEGEVAFEATEVPVTLALAVDVQEETSAPNVVGILRGSDPTLNGEYVLYSAHMDHVGVGRPDAAGDSIYNGADDDASGTATVMEVAEAMASLPSAPRRSQVFLLVSGEEKGLWGSAHFADNPTVPLEQVVANLNADMVGRNWPDTIVAIGKEHSDLGATLERVNAAHPEIGMTAIDDIWPEQNFYRRSDHFNFARKGVPILFFFNGTHEDYHRPSDHVEAIDAEKTARIGALLFYLGLEVADADMRPQWNPDSYAEIVEGN